MIELLRECRDYIAYVTGDGNDKPVKILKRLDAALAGKEARPHDAQTPLLWLVGQQDKNMKMLYYRKGHPLDPKSWTHSFNRAKRLTSEQVAAFQQWATSLHDCKFIIE